MGARPRRWMPICVVGAFATACDPSVELTVGTGRHAAALHALRTVLGPTVPLEPGLAGGLRVPVAQAENGRAVLQQLGLDRGRPAEPPRLVVGPTEAAARERRRAVVDLEATLLRRPGVVAADAFSGFEAAAVTVWHLPDPDWKHSTDTCAFVRHVLGPGSRCEIRPFEPRPLPAPGAGDDGRRELTLWASAACLLLSATLAGLAWRARRSERSV